MISFYGVTSTNQKTKLSIGLAIHNKNLCLVFDKFEPIMLFDEKTGLSKRSGWYLADRLYASCKHFLFKLEEAKNKLEGEDNS